jgi:hypothetical protein
MAPETMGFVEEYEKSPRKRIRRGVDEAAMGVGFTMG